MKATKPTSGPARTATAPLLYWLLVVCGLVGLSVQRIDTPRDLAPLWIGTVAGVGLGQLVGWMRVRAWVLTVIGIGALWISPIFFFVLYQSIKSPVETCIFAFLPAAVCGYLSLSERGALVSFWYPAVLWMLVILDGPGSASSSFDTHTALPLVIGLAGLFVAFLRARETRRTAIWSSHGTVRLAKARPRNVLRASPFQSASQYAWTGLAGATALVLAAWVAPHLWQTEQTKGPKTKVAMQQGARTDVRAVWTKDTVQEHCCAVGESDANRRERVREYFPLFHGRDSDAPVAWMQTCDDVCRGPAPVASSSSDGNGSGSYSGASGAYGTYGNGYPGPYGQYNGNYGGAPITTPSFDVAPTVQSPITSTLAPTVMGAEVAPIAPVAVAAPVEPAHVAGAAPIVTPTKPKPKPTPSPAALPGTSPATSPARASTNADPAAVALAPAAPSTGLGAPWKSALVLCFGGLAMHVMMRATRRQLTLRHLTRPFWSETLDQRISNHWQRILIGLRDAGIHVARDEQPEALAKRVGLDGMATCAKILERVRHGVRVDNDDLDAMSSAAGAVYRAAREKAGITGRAAGMVRWPLA